LQAAAISNVGMHDIVAEPEALSVPFLFRDEEQMQCAFKKVRPRLEQALEKRGYVAVQWSTVGAVHLFCDKPHRSPADMGEAKIWVWEGDPKSVEAFRAAGFKTVILSSSDIVPSLQTGMINCLPNVPLYMLTTRLFERAPNMQDVSWAYIVGATVVRKETWERIPAELRPKLLSIAEELGDRIDGEVRRLNQDAISAMEKQGLKIVPSDAAAWRSAMDKANVVVRGGVVPVAIFDQVVAAREACNAEAKK
ncbi:MAG TPA: TRAP transporter substrate-binding protein DctP, partial [Anaeromyxobacter sp.]|nr:TRAP transporter substrate-binding protein DctP [Anaeromyxobacter sp.]